MTIIDKARHWFSRQTFLHQDPAFFITQTTPYGEMRVVPIRFNIYDVPPEHEPVLLEQFANNLQNDVKKFMQCARRCDSAVELPESVISSHIAFDNGTQADFNSMLFTDADVNSSNKADAKSKEFATRLINWARTVPECCWSEEIYWNSVCSKKKKEYNQVSL